MYTLRGFRIHFSPHIHSLIDASNRALADGHAHWSDDCHHPNQVTLQVTSSYPPPQSTGRASTSEQPRPVVNTQGTPRGHHIVRDITPVSRSQARDSHMGTPIRDSMQPYGGPHKGFSAQETQYLVLRPPRMSCSHYTQCGGGWYRL